MSLRNKAVLEIDLPSEDTTGVFVLKGDLTDMGEVNKQFLMSNRGQYIREIFDIGSDLLPDEVADADLERRKGYYVDGGAGEYSETLSFEAGPGDGQWGDGSTNPTDPDQYSKTDATGAPPTVRKQVLEWYVSQARTDAQGQAMLHIGEWTDGSHSDAAGVFERPLPVAIRELSITDDPDEPSVIEGTVECVWTAVFPDVDVIGGAQEAIDQVAELIPDF